MADECRCCGGRCREPQPLEFSRRDFLEKLAVGAAALAVTGQMAWADEGDTLLPPTPPRATGLGRYPLTPRRVYRGKHLEAVGMPLGGIGTGSIWLNGQGQLGIWQIFNNLSEPRVPDSFLAVRAKTATGPAVARVLQTQGEGSLRPVESIDYEGGYPIARLTFHDAALPVEVVLEALNPMIPLGHGQLVDPLRAVSPDGQEPGQRAGRGRLLRNAAKCGGKPGGRADSRACGSAATAAIAIAWSAATRMTVVAMDKAPDPVASGPVKVRTAAGKEVPGPELLWLAGLPDLTAQTAEPLARIAAEGGVVLADGVSPAFFESLAKLRASQGDFNAVATVFDDFEGKTYEGWTIVGDAFGKGPSHGTEPGQQPVTGFSGHGLVNTFVERRRPAGHGHVEALSHPAAVHWISHRRRQ